VLLTNTFRKCRDFLRDKQTGMWRGDVPKLSSGHGVLLAEQEQGTCGAVCSNDLSTAEAARRPPPLEAVVGDHLALAGDPFPVHPSDI
jgi:hypothetical protein